MTEPEVDLILYTTMGCHLCEQAEALLATVAVILSRELVIEAIDIAEDAELVERFGIRIPVLKRTVDEAELNWPFDAQQLLRFLLVLQTK